MRHHLSVPVAGSAVSVQEIQRRLAAAGFDPGPIDGVVGRKTLDALDAALRQARPLGGLSPAESVLQNAIDPGLAILPERMDTLPARLIMLAISGQEADFHHRWQVFDLSRPDAMGAARGLWQFERGGGVKGVLTHPASRGHAAAVCAARGVAPDVAAVYGRLHADDVLAAALARLLLWTSPAALPAIGDEEGAWQAYLREWRPGAYTNGNAKKRSELREKWRGYYAEARRVLGV